MACVCKSVSLIPTYLFLFFTLSLCKTTFITNEVWYSIKYHLKFIGNAMDISMHFGGFETVKEFLFVMTLLLNLRNVYKGYYKLSIKLFYWRNINQSFNWLLYLICNIWNMRTWNNLNIKYILINLISYYSNLYLYNSSFVLNIYMMYINNKYKAQFFKKIICLLII